MMFKSLCRLSYSPASLVFMVGILLALTIKVHSAERPVFDSGFRHCNCVCKQGGGPAGVHCQASTLSQPNCKDMCQVECAGPEQVDLTKTGRLQAGACPMPPPSAQGPVTPEELIQHVAYSIWHQGANVWQGETDNFPSVEELRGRLATVQNGRGYEVIRDAAQHVLVAATTEAVVRCVQGKLQRANTDPYKIKQHMLYLRSKIGSPALNDLKDKHQFSNIRTSFTAVQSDTNDKERRDQTKHVIYCYNGSQITQIINTINAENPVAPSKNPFKPR